jgi:hypothetical protein
MHLRFHAGLYVMTVLAATPLFAAHPQTVWTAAELSNLQRARTTTHAMLANHLTRYLDVNSGAVNGPYVGGYAMITRIMNRLTSNAVTQLQALCTASWNMDHDLRQPEALASAAIGYDVLYDLLTSTQRTACSNKIAAAASDLANSINGNIWWVEDLANNHNWVNFAALGLAGQALEGEHGSAATWQQMARNNFTRVKTIQDLASDGSWHEGIGYMEFGVSRPLFYWLGEIRRTNTTNDQTNLLRRLGTYILYQQAPNHTRIQVMTHGDWNWSRPAIVAILRWAARRFRDPHAQEAARRWDNEPRSTTGWLTRLEFAQDFALEYIAYDPAVSASAPGALDRYNFDQQSVFLRSSWGAGNTTPASDTIVVGFKAGVSGGRGNHDRMRSCTSGILNYGHDHTDDLSLWIYGKGGWLLPENVAYKLHPAQFDSTQNFDSTRWHNSILFNDAGQLGDDKSVSGEAIACGSSTPSWFWQREANISLVASTRHYALARADAQPCAPGSTACPKGKGLYPSTAGVQMLLRTVGLSRENGGFITLQDRILLGAAKTVEQTFHSLNPSGTYVDSSTGVPWLRLDNSTVAYDTTPTSSTVLGIRVISPAGASIATQSPLPKDTYWTPVDDDGLFGYVKIGAPSAASNIVFVEVLWPGAVSTWSSRPQVQPLDSSRPQRGFTVSTPAGPESWIYNLAGSTTAAGALTITGTTSNDVGVVRYTTSGVPVRMFVAGKARLLDQRGSRILLDTSPSTAAALEVAVNGARANLSSSASAKGASFYGPAITQVFVRGVAVTWTRSGSVVTVTQ